MISVKFDERLAFKLRELYSSYGYTHYRMSKFEEYELYLKNKDFLSSPEVITFTDTTGKLMALKPDVTLSIIKNLRSSVGVQKVFYHENVYRVSKNSGSFREIMQTGLECIGDIGSYEKSEAVLLAVKSLEATGRNFRLDLSHMGLLTSLIRDLDLPADGEEGLITCIKRKNADGAAGICRAFGVPEEKILSLTALIGLYGRAKEGIGRLREIFPGGEAAATLSELSELIDSLDLCGCADCVNLDFSVIHDMNYYNGIVFRGYVEGVPDGILSGGCYDLLMKKTGRDCGAIGFAVALDGLNRLEENRREYDYDVALSFEGSAAGKVLPAVQKLVKEGKTVFAAGTLPPGLRAAQVLRITAEGALIPEGRNPSYEDGKVNS